MEDGGLAGHQDVRRAVSGGQGAMVATPSRVIMSKSETRTETRPSRSPAPAASHRRRSTRRRRSGEPSERLDPGVGIGDKKRHLLRHQRRGLRRASTTTIVTGPARPGVTVIMAMPLSVWMWTSGRCDGRSHERAGGGVKRHRATTARIAATSTTSTATEAARRRVATASPASAGAVSHSDSRWRGRRGGRAATPSPGGRP